MSDDPGAITASILSARLPRQLSDTVRLRLEQTGHRLPALSSGEPSVVREWVVEVVAMATREDLAIRLIPFMRWVDAHITPDTRARSVMRTLREGVVRGARLDQPPPPAPIDPALAARGRELVRFGSPDTWSTDELTRVLRLMAALARNDALDMSRFARTLPNDVDPDAVARAFPLWDDGVERRALPLNASRIELMTRSCASIDAPEADLVRTQALAWRRLVQLTADAPELALDAFVDAKRLRTSDPLVRLICGVDLYCGGLTEEARRVWSIPEPVGQSTPTSEPAPTPRPPARVPRHTMAPEQVSHTVRRVRATRTLRALTPHGSSYDVRAAITLHARAQDILDLFVPLLREERPDLYAQLTDSTGPQGPPPHDC